MNEKIGIEDYEFLEFAEDKYKRYVDCIVQRIDEGNLGEGDLELINNILELERSETSQHHRGR